jgi:tRNA(Ile)-lysidine synthase TilS/MesJ
LRDGGREEESLKKELPRSMPENKIVLAYSGGLDTTVAVPWLKERKR